MGLAWAGWVGWVGWAGLGWAWTLFSHLQEFKKGMGFSPALSATISNPQRRPFPATLQNNNNNFFHDTTTWLGDVRATYRCVEGPAHNNNNKATQQDKTKSWQRFRISNKNQQQHGIVAALGVSLLVRAAGHVATPTTTMPSWFWRTPRPGVVGAPYQLPSLGRISRRPAI